MNNSKLINWVLRVSVAGEFIGHGVFALQGKADWVQWISQLTGVGVEQSAQLLWLVGLMDVALALLILVRPVRAALLWMAFWGFWTALVRPLVGLPVWDFVERWANWGAPLALLLLRGMPRNAKDWFR